MGSSSALIPPDVSSAADRRVLTDRRAAPTTLWRALQPGGQRRGFRRAGEARNRYVDRLAPQTVFLALLVLGSSILDAILTLRHIQNGGWELNPLMHLVLDGGVSLFVAVKVSATGLGVVFLAIHQNFLAGRLALKLAAIAYLALLFYHALLVAF